MTIKAQFKALVHDWYKYMNTVIPSGVNGQFFTDTMYSNRERMHNLTEKYPEIDSRVIEQEAIRQYFHNNDEQIRENIGVYYGEQGWRKNYGRSEKVRTEN